MGLGCAVPQCKNSRPKNKKLPTEEQVLFHKFPKEAAFKLLWIILCNQSDNRVKTFNPKNARICSAHFTPEDYEHKYTIDGLTKKTLKPSSVPTVNLTEDFSAKRTKSIIRAASIVKRDPEQFMKEMLLALVASEYDTEASLSPTDRNELERTPHLRDLPPLSRVPPIVDADKPLSAAEKRDIVYWNAFIEEYKKILSI